jgi:hypothetical protein
MVIQNAWAKIHPMDPMSAPPSDIRMIAGTKFVMQMMI